MNVIIYNRIKIYFTCLTIDESTWDSFIGQVYNLATIEIIKKKPSDLVSNNISLYAIGIASQFTDLPRILSGNTGFSLLQ